MNLFYGSFATMLILFAAQTYYNQTQFLEILTNQRDVIEQYERIEKIDKERIAQNDNIKRSFEEFVASHNKLSVNCVDLWRKHVKDDGNK